MFSGFISADVSFGDEIATARPWGPNSKSGRSDLRTASLKHGAAHQTSEDHSRRGNTILDLRLFPKGITLVRAVGGRKLQRWYLLDL
jgi:hypothetical protein